MALLAGMTFAACSSDDDNGGKNCQTCELTDEANYNVCEGPDGTVVIDGEDTELTVAEYIDLFCDNETEEPTGECVTCAAYEIQGQTVPATEVCKGDNGNAFVQGMDTQQNYETFINGMEMLTTCE